MNNRLLIITLALCLFSLPSYARTCTGSQSRVVTCLDHAGNPTTNTSFCLENLPAPPGAPAPTSSQTCTYSCPPPPSNDDDGNSGYDSDGDGSIDGDADRNTGDRVHDAPEDNRGGYP